MATPMKDDGIDLLYPDLLSKEGLLFNLRKRYVRISETDLETLDKESLVNLYNKYILPLPQRKYRNNLRGKEMQKKQILRDKKKRKFTMSEEDGSVSAKKKGRLSQDNPSGPSCGLVNNFTLSPASSRLKPPPSCIDTSKKVVKLSSSALPTSPSKQNESDKSTSPVTSSNKLIKLNITKKSNDEATKRSADVNEEEEKSPKKKFKPIKWP